MQHGFSQRLRVVYLLGEALELYASAAKHLTIDQIENDKIFLRMPIPLLGVRGLTLRSCACGYLHIFRSIALRCVSHNGERFRARCCSSSKCFTLKHRAFWYIGLRGAKLDRWMDRLEGRKGQRQAALERQK